MIRELLLKWLSGGGPDLSLTASAQLNPEINKGNSKSSKKQNKRSKITFKNKGDVHLNVIHISKDPDEAEIKMLRDTLMPVFNKDDIMFVEDKPVELLNEYQNYSKSNPNEELLDFFKDKLSTTDFTLLQTGLYINHLMETDQNSSRVKSGVINAHGEREKNVVNLASAGYFKSHFKPLYEELDRQPGETKELFAQEYESIVLDLPFVVFVNRQTVDSIVDQVKAKANKNTKYAIKEDRILLHGFGTNAELLEEAATVLKSIFKKVANNSEYRGSLKIAKATIFYKEGYTDQHIESQQEQAA